jgi:hypothetical protein
MGKAKQAFEDLLTEEEIAALADDEGGADPGETETDAEDEGDPDAGEAGAEEGDGDGNDKPDAAAAAEGADEDPQAVKTEPDVTAQPDAAAAAAAEEPAAAAHETTTDTDPDEIPEDVDAAIWLNKVADKERVKEVDAALDALAAKFDDGEMTAQEYRQQQRQLQDKRDDLRSAVEQATFHETAANQTWTKACREFMKDNPMYAKQGPLSSMLDAEVRRIQNAYIDKGLNYFDPGILTRAETNVRKSAAELLGVQIDGKGEKPKQDAAADAGGKQPPAPTQPKPAAAQARKEQPVPTLSAVPVAGEEAIGNGEFAWLDRLADSDPLKYEAEMKKLETKDPEKYQQYLAYTN